MLAMSVIGKQKQASDAASVANKQTSEAVLVLLTSLL